MTKFNEYQNTTGMTAIYPEDKALEYLSLGLVSEAGEVAGAVKKVIRDDDGVLTHKSVDNLVAEIGDVLWYISELCTTLRVELGDVADENIQKLLDRQRRGVLKGSGDKR